MMHRKFSKKMLYSSLFPCISWLLAVQGEASASFCPPDHEDFHTGSQAAVRPGSGVGQQRMLGRHVLREGWCLEGLLLRLSAHPMRRRKGDVHLLSPFPLRSASLVADERGVPPQEVIAANAMSRKVVISLFFIFSPLKPPLM